MSEFTEADTIRILVATDNHVGYEERDPIRKDDSWQTFDEIINMARKEDVRRNITPTCSLRCIFPSGSCSY